LFSAESAGARTKATATIEVGAYAYKLLLLHIAVNIPPFFKEEIVD